MSETISNIQKGTSETLDTDLLFYRLKKKARPVFEVAERNLKKAKRRIDLEDIIGFGGFAVVAKGHTDLLLDGREVENHPCAVKIVYPERIYGPDSDVNNANRKRFINEYSSTRQVYTNLEKLGTGLEKHLVRAYDYGEFDDTYWERNTDMVGNIAEIYKEGLISWRYIVSEYVEGRELGQYRGKLSIKDIVQVGRVICQVLEVTHSQEFLHRDIKPTNILIPNGTIEDLKLGDFGLAKRTDVAVPVYSSILGSVGFAAPEQMDPESKNPVDGRADIYGLAATLYFMITGHYAYSEEDTKLLIGKENKPISRPAPLTEFVDQPGLNELSEVLITALAPYREKRHKNISEFMVALDRVYKKL